MKKSASLLTDQRLTDLCPPMFSRLYLQLYNFKYIHYVELQLPWQETGLVIFKTSYLLPTCLSHTVEALHCFFFIAIRQIIKKL